MRRGRLFIGFAVTIALVVVVGFGKTFFVPLVSGQFGAPPIVFIHGALFFTWTAVFVLQVAWIRKRQLVWHRRVGWFGACLVVPMVVSLVGVGVYAVDRDLGAGRGPAAASQIVGVCTAAIIFASLVTAGIRQRGRPAVHRRLMLLATIAISWPAFQRLRHYIPSLPHPDILLGLVLADLPIVIAMVHDKVTRGSVHPVYRTIGVLLIAEQITEIALYDSRPWRALGHWLFSVFA